MKFRKDFIGFDGFYWWFGVVENRIDPLQLGRCQVRIFGTHTEDLSLIPSEDLPWAHPIHSLNNQSFSTPKEGDYVFGFFVDGKYQQSPVMVGIVPGIPSESTDPNNGFADLRDPSQINNAPTPPKSLTYDENGEGVTIEEYENDEELSTLRNPSENQIGFPTNSNLARNENLDLTVIKARRENLKSVVGANNTSWDEPYPAYSAEYPYNKALETESGHAMEFDDTPGAERVHIAHRSGSFSELYPSGSKVEKIVKNNYKLVLSDDHLYVTGKVNITIESHANIRVVGDVNLQAENNLNAEIAGAVNINAGESFNVKSPSIVLEATDTLSATSVNNTEFNSGANFNITAGDTFNQISGGSSKITAPGSVDIQAIGTFNVDASTLSWNNGDSTPASASDPATTGLNDYIERGTPTDAPFYIEQTPADRSAVFFDSGEEGVDGYIEEQIAAGIYTQEQLDESQNLQEGESDSSDSPNVAPTDVSDCSDFVNRTTFPITLELSTNYTLGSLTSEAPFGDRLVAQRNLTKGQIVCNLSQLAKNCLEPILAEYPDMIVTNAFRTPTAESAGRSQHEIGQAADIQFSNASKSDYYNIVLWIRDNVPHDQLLLEYKTTGTGLPWIHISFNKDGNRPPGPTKNMTFVNHKSVKPFFVNLA